MTLSELHQRMREWLVETETCSALMIQSDTTTLSYALFRQDTDRLYTTSLLYTVGISP